jgi:hypothetical protein
MLIVLEEICVNQKLHTVGKTVEGIEGIALINALVKLFIIAINSKKEQAKIK